MKVPRQDSMSPTNSTLAPEQSSQACTSRTCGRPAGPRQRAGNPPPPARWALPVPSAAGMRPARQGARTRAWCSWSQLCRTLGVRPRGRAQGASLAATATSPPPSGRRVRATIAPAPRAAGGEAQCHVQAGQGVPRQRGAPGRRSGACPWRARGLGSSDAGRPCAHRSGRAGRRGPALPHARAAAYRPGWQPGSGSAAGRPGLARAASLTRATLLLLPGAAGGHAGRPADLAVPRRCGFPRALQSGKQASW